jgi:hypothetical protein
MKWILLIFICGFFASDILALRCVTSDGLQVDEVRRVVKKCMKKIANVDSLDDMTKNYDEYENFDDDNGNEDEGDERSSDGNSRKKNNNHNSNQFNNHYYDYQLTGRNYEMSRRNSHLPQYSQYSQYSDNNHRGDFYGNNNQNKNNNNDNSTSHGGDKSERDRSCILQCFFQELKMVCTNEQLHMRSLFPLIQFNSIFNFSFFSRNHFLFFHPFHLHIVRLLISFLFL